MKRVQGYFLFALLAAIAVGSLSWSKPASAMKQLSNCGLYDVCVTIGGQTSCESWIICDEGAWQV